MTQPALLCIQERQADLSGKRVEGEKLLKSGARHGDRVGEIDSRVLFETEYSPHSLWTKQASWRSAPEVWEPLNKEQEHNGGNIIAGSGVIQMREMSEVILISDVFIRRPKSLFTNASWNAICNSMSQGG